MSVNVLNHGEPLEGKEPLWRYMKLSTFLMLLEGKAFFPSVATLRAGDPLEGDLVPDATWLMGKLHTICGADTQQFLEWLEGKANTVESISLRDNWGGPFGKSDILAQIYVREWAKRRAV